MTESERWDVIEAALPMLRSICKGTLQRANCVTMSTEELLSELLPQCFDWLARFDPAINPDPLALLNVSSRLRARAIVQRAIARNGNRMPLDDLSPEEQPSYVVDMSIQLDGQSVLTLLDMLPTRQAYIVRNVLDGVAHTDIATELGLRRNRVYVEWHLAMRTLAALMNDQS